MYKALYLSPMIPSNDVRVTIGFFENIFSFTLIRDDDNYAILTKDNLTVHVCRAGKDIGEMSIYLEVDDIDRLWTSVKDKLKGMKVREPFDRGYGMREFHVIVPNTRTLLFAGQIKV